MRPFPTLHHPPCCHALYTCLDSLSYPPCLTSRGSGFVAKKNVDEGRTLLVGQPIETVVMTANLQSRSVLLAAKASMVSRALVRYSCALIAQFDHVFASTTIAPFLPLARAV